MYLTFKLILTCQPFTKKSQVFTLRVILVLYSQMPLCPSLTGREPHLLTAHAQAARRKACPAVVFNY